MKPFDARAEVHSLIKMCAIGRHVEHEVEAIARYYGWFDKLPPQGKYATYKVMKERCSRHKVFSALKTFDQARRYAKGSSLERLERIHDYIYERAPISWDDLQSSIKVEMPFKLNLTPEGVVSALDSFLKKSNIALLNGWAVPLFCISGREQSLEQCKSAMCDALLHCGAINLAQLKQIGLADFSVREIRAVTHSVSDLEFIGVNKRWIVNSTQSPNRILHIHARYLKSQDKSICFKEYLERFNNLNSYYERFIIEYLLK